METIKKELQVNAPQQTAFRVFTEQMDSWWPRTHHIGKVPMTKQILETFPNGRWYSTHEDGSRVEVGYVKEYTPYDKLVLVWQVNGEFRHDPELHTEVEVKFIPEGRESTRVLFEHRNIERLGGAKTLGSMEEGWGMIMNLFKAVADKAFANAY